MNVFLDQLQGEQIPEVWSYAMGLRRTNNELARGVMAALLRHLPALSPDQNISAKLQELVLAWLDLPEAVEAVEAVAKVKDYWHFLYDNSIL